MTIQQLYDWAYEEGVLNYKIKKTPTSSIKNNPTIIDKSVYI